MGVPCLGTMHSRGGMAYSVGHWDGDTLVVETKGFRDNMWIDEQGTPITSAGESPGSGFARALNYGNLEIEIRVDDPRKRLPNPGVSS